VASVGFLRAANVGTHNRFQPSVLTKQLARFGVVNVGAVGTFVVRENVTEKALRAAILRKLPFKCEIMICSGREIVDLVRGNPLKNEPTDNDRSIVLSVLSEPTEDLPTFSLHSP